MPNTALNLKAKEKLSQMFYIYLVYSGAYYYAVFYSSVDKIWCTDWMVENYVGRLYLPANQVPNYLPHQRSGTDHWCGRRLIWIWTTISIGEPGSSTTFHLHRTKDEGQSQWTFRDRVNKFMSLGIYNGLGLWPKVCWLTAPSLGAFLSWSKTFAVYKT